MPYIYNTPLMAQQHLLVKQYFYYKTQSKSQTLIAKMCRM